MKDAWRHGRRWFVCLLFLLASAPAGRADRFVGGGFDGYDADRFDQEFYGNRRFTGSGFDGCDQNQECTVHIPFGRLSLDTTNVVIQYAGGHTNVTYSLLAFNSHLTNLATVLYQVANTNAFAFTDTNALGSVDRRFYRVAEDLAGVVSTNPWVYTVFRRQLEPGAWSKYALGINYGNSNRLDSTLGIQLGQGLTGNSTKEVADLFYLLDSKGNWQICYLDGGGVWREYSSGNATNTQVLSWQSFWIKRKGGGVSYPVYSGYCFTESAPVLFRSNEWHMITWQLPWDRKESAGSDAGWGFAAAGGQKGGSWLNSDLLTVGDGSALRFYYLHTSGRWCAVGKTTPAADVNLRAGESCYYLHRGMGMVWTAGE